MYDIELVGTAIKLLHDIFDVQKGESVVITADTESNYEVVEATAQAAFALGAKPMIVKIAAPRGVGKTADPDFPMEPLKAVLCAADVWIEYNNEWIFYSSAYDAAYHNNKKLRYMNLCGANPDLLVRNIGRVDVPTLRDFILKVTDLTAATKHMRITTPAGTDVEFDNCPGREYAIAEGIVKKGQVKMMPGQISWAPIFETINGVIVIDGTLTPPLGKVNEPIKLTIEKGYIVKVEGGQQAKEFEDWLKNFNDKGMYLCAHLSYGFGPGAKLTGDIVEDERVWGSTEWGFGNVGPQLVSDIPGGIPAASHTDGICLNSTVYMDGKLFLKDGEVVGPTEEFVKLARKLGK